MITNTSLDELGPADLAIVEFLAQTANFAGATVDKLLRLVESQTIRLIDVLILVKDVDGSIEAMELSDLDDLGPRQRLETELAELLAEDDEIHLAEAMDPGSTAAVVI